ncbi:c-type cytochrome [Meiothermus sp. CFH 77666]|uniref:tetratricopeptide repeat protein n=1 Tax=Meiothermus sp. CFH 77666 TaxID=2817942 RepID=UPI001AA011A4|nr:c-type cytochrome [Meiothermus sp. CFH 77666]MBO1437438.1 c-type cytochrome [Meiothermus sp. CFH 77666]
MILAYLFLALLFVLALAYALRPFFRSEAQPFPESPRPEELRAELAVLKSLAQEAEGDERKRLLAQAVRLERQLAELGSEHPVPRRLSPVTLGAVTLSLVALGVGLWAYTVPRLPGETIITSRNEARELGNLQRQAEQSGKAADWLAYANKAYDLQDFERAVQGYLKVIELEPRNANAVRRLGILLFMSGRPEEGAQALELAVRAEPDVPEGWLFLGNAYFQLGRPAEAIVAWEGYLKAGGEAKERVQNLIQTAKNQLSATSNGQQVYLGKCAACHGAQAQGGTGPRLQGNPIRKVPEAVREIVLKGRGQMPAVPLTEAEMQALLQYLGGL